MECSSHCMNCLASKQFKRIKDEVNEESKKNFLKEVMKQLSEIKSIDTAPYLSYKFDLLYYDYFHKKDEFDGIKQEFNQLVLDFEQELKANILSANDPLEKAILYSMIGNYIDFGAMDHVSKEDFLNLFNNPRYKHLNSQTYNQFKEDCKNGSTFLLIADNCGEIVLDRFVLEILHKTYPHLDLTVMVKGGNISNDATIEDAKQAGIDQVATLVTTGNAIAGCDQRLISKDANHILQTSDITLCKGQANFETLYGMKEDAYFAFLCKCDYFANRFNVEKFSGMFILN